MNADSPGTKTRESAVQEDELATMIGRAAATDPEAESTALLLIADPRKRAHLHALLTRNGCPCVATRDRESALSHVCADLSIGVVIAETAGPDGTDHSIIGELRQRSLRPLAAILLVPEPSYQLLRQIAQSGPADILPRMPSDEELLAAVRAALGWYQRSLHMGGLSQNVLRMLAQIESQLGRLATEIPPKAAGEPQKTETAPVTAAIAPAGGDKPALDRETLKAVMRVHSTKARLLGNGLMDDAAWVMLLDLLLMHLENKPLAVTALCVSSGVPVTTALRRLDQLIGKGLALKTPDYADRRRLLVSITPKGIECVSAIVQHMQGELRSGAAA
jgi:DNA-binding NarL/FixJ family response regulator/predicted transcriptional regulator